MKRQIAKIALGLAVLLCASIPASATEVFLSFTTNTAGGTVVVDGTNTVTAIDGAPYTQLLVVTVGVGAAPYAITSGLLNLSSDTLTLKGNITGLGITSDPTLLTIDLASSLTNVGTGPPVPTLEVSINSPTSVTVGSALLGALGISGTTTLGNNSGLVGGSITCPMDTSAGSSCFDVTSDTLSAEVVTPEPASLLLFASGMAGIAFSLRRKRARRA